MHFILQLQPECGAQLRANAKLKSSRVFPTGSSIVGLLAPSWTHTNTFLLQAFISGFTLPVSFKTNQVNRQWEAYKAEEKKIHKSKET